MTIEESILKRRLSINQIIFVLIMSILIIVMTLNVPECSCGDSCETSLQINSYVSCLDMEWYCYLVAIAGIIYAIQQYYKKETK